MQVSDRHVAYDPSEISR